MKDLSYQENRRDRVAEKAATIFTTSRRWRCTDWIVPPHAFKWKSEWRLKKASTYCVRSTIDHPSDTPLKQIRKLSANADHAKRGIIDENAILTVIRDAAPYSAPMSITQYYSQEAVMIL